ncbi:MAG: FecR domain-containing protein, partial [Burkholderiaceae bacterium]
MRIIFLVLGLLWLCPAQAAGEPAAGAPGTVDVGSAAITYYAQTGDTLLAIASRYTSRAANWAELGKLNRIDRDVSIPVGSAIVIPARLLPEEPNQARIVAFSGQVSASAADGTPIPVAVGSVLTEGSRIDTGGNSFLTLALADQSRIAIPSNSRVRLTKLRMTRYTGSPRTEITLLRGRVESWVAPLEQRKGRFEIHTPQSVSGVRGTHFRVALSERGAASEVLDGSVDTGTAAAPATLTLRRGHGNVVGPGGVGPAIALLA